MNGDISQNKAIAHVKKHIDGVWDIPHYLRDHLINAAYLAGEFAGVFNSETWGYALGIGHDTGKSKPEWQRWDEAAE